MRHHLFRHAIGQAGLDPAHLIDGGQFTRFGERRAIQFGRLAQQVRAFGIGLRTDRDIFPRRHRECPSDQRRYACQQDGARRRAGSGCDAHNQAGDGDDAVIRAQYGGP